MTTDPQPAAVCVWCLWLGGFTMGIVAANLFSIIFGWIQTRYRNDH